MGLSLMVESVDDGNCSRVVMVAVIDGEDAVGCV
jgi:hypothetical protein